MAHFYGTITGSRGTTVTKTGTKDSGIEGHIRGWNVGVKVVCTHRNGKDECRIYETGGSSGYADEKLIHTVKED